VKNKKKKQPVKKKWIRRRSVSIERSKGETFEDIFHWVVGLIIVGVFVYFITVSASKRLDQIEQQKLRQQAVQQKFNNWERNGM